MRWSVEAIAAAIGGQVEGDGARQLSGLLGLEDAGPEHLSFLSNPRYLRAFRSSRAGAILVGQRESALGHTVIRCADPYAAFSKALRLFHPEQRPAPGIHPQAVVEGEATCDPQDVITTTKTRRRIAWSMAISSTAMAAQTTR